jgi:hypothetical protein
MNRKQYQLYFSEKPYKLEIKPLANMFQKYVKENNQLIKYNQCYYFGTLNNLREKANQLKKQWLDELQKHITEIDLIKI